MARVSAPDPFAPAKLGPITLRNRIIKAATFEGMTPRRLVTERLIEFHRRVAAGGAGMSTVAYCAVSPDGTTDGRQIVLTEDAVPGLRRLTDAIHAEGAAACAQIGHAGPVASPAATKHSALSPSRFRTPAFYKTRAATEADLARVKEDFSHGARVAVEAGFDALEVHLGHNYLLSSFLSPRLNKRDDEWGGSLENRARFPRAVVRSVREAVGPRVAVTAKLNMEDGVRGGLEVEDSIEFAKMLQADGALDALELTGGSSLLNPMYLFRGDVPRKEFGATMPGVLRIGFKIVGRRYFREYPFEEAFFMPNARRFRDALEMPLILLGGINTLDTINEGLAGGFEFVAMARALLREPDLVNQMWTGRSKEGLCDHSNKCMPTIYRGTRCVLIAEDER
jgi:2,4-dienoyl-CoA reductase-like NADH-dependent reductase (Old Yellow Enzyme family)